MINLNMSKYNMEDLCETVLRNFSKWDCRLYAVLNVVIEPKLLEKLRKMIKVYDEPKLMIPCWECAEPQCYINDLGFFSFEDTKKHRTIFVASRAVAETYFFLDGSVDTIISFRGIRFA